MVRDAEPDPTDDLGLVYNALGISFDDGQEIEILLQNRYDNCKEKNIVSSSIAFVILEQYSLIGHSRLSWRLVNRTQLAALLRMCSMSPAKL